MMEAHSSPSPDTQVTLLLCGHFTGSEEQVVRPLTPVEYNRLAKRLVALGLRPADLLSGNPTPATLVPPDVIAPERLDRLLQRGAAMALALDRWSQLGVGVLGRSDAAYPAKLRSRLKALAPPVLFVAGQAELLGSDALCVVGSRDATASGLRFARAMGAACAREGLAVVSGNARGVDQEAMQGALDAGGRAIGILAEALGKAVLAKRNRQAIMDGALVLASPFSPDARFTVAHAMDRNKYLYGMSLAAIVVDSDVKGGTWSGAVENNKHGWVPAFIRMGGELREGNSHLARLGLSPITEEVSISRGALRELLARGASDRPRSAQETVDETRQLHLDDAVPASSEQRTRRRSSSHPTIHGEPPAGTVGGTPAGDLFAFFVSQLTPFLEMEPRSEQQVAEYFAIECSQARRWLEKACEQHLLIQIGNPPRYARSSFEDTSLERSRRAQ